MPLFDNPEKTRDITRLGVKESTQTHQREYVFDVILDQRKNVFITAGGGSGKSYLLRQVYEEAIRRGYKKDEIALTSTTGVSAYNIRGQTIHSWCGIVLPPHFSSMSASQQHDSIKWMIRRARERRFAGSIRAAKILLIDEISMLGGYYLEVLDYVCKTIRENTSPLGGIQLVSTGDLMQLQSVGDVFIFESAVWDEIDCTYIILETFYRFTDPRWTELLSRCRLGELTEEDRQILQSRVISRSKLDHWGQGPNSEGYRPTMILPTHKLVTEYNQADLARLPGITSKFESEDSVYLEYEVEGVVCPSRSVKQSLSDEHLKKMDSIFPIDRVFEVKRGSLVMLRKNFSIEGGLVNGCRGMVIDIHDAYRGVLVRWERENISIGIRWGTDLYPVTEAQLALSKNKPTDCEWIFPVAFQSREFLHKTTSIPLLRAKEGDIIEEISEYQVRERFQLPLTLAASITIHSSQGCTLRSIAVDIGKSIFSRGQSYVALSRCKSLEGVYILNLDFKRIRADSDAKSYESRIRKNAIFIREN